MWAYHQVSGDQEVTSKEEKLVSGVVASCQAALLSSCLLPVYTLKQGDQLLDYFALPAVRLLLEWIRGHPGVITEKGFTTRPQIWPGLARLLNEVKPLIAEFDGSHLKDYPLPEDYDMQAFSPLQSVLTKYNMKQVLKGGIEDNDVLARLRCSRLVEIGHDLCNHEPKVISYSEESEKFESVDNVSWINVKEDPDVLVEEIEMLEDIDSSEDSDSPLPVWDESQASSEQDKTKSILKMKSDSTPSPSSPVPSPVSSVKPKPKLFQRNVAMAAIMNSVGAEMEDNKMLTTGDSKKTVMFKTPSPSNSQSSSNIDSNSQFSASQDDLPVPLLPNPPPPPRTGHRRS